MWKLNTLLAIGVLTMAGGSIAQQPAPLQSPGDISVPKVCKYVVSADPGAKPYELCLTKDEWTAKKLADAKDPNRMVCHYEETPGTRLRSRKVCQSATAWAEQQRLEREAVEKLQSSVCVPGAGC